jgi:hypothetical protein
MLCDVHLPLMAQLSRLAVSQVLCNGEAMWQLASEGQVPADAFPVGITSDGERLYVGRVFHDGTLTPGKVNTSSF